MRLEEAIMSSESLNEPDSRSEEDRLIETIIKLRAELDRIVSTTGPSKRSLSIHIEITRLLDQISIYKARTEERKVQISQDKC